MQEIMGQSSIHDHFSHAWVGVGTYAFQVARAATEPLNVRALGLRKLDVQPAVVQLLLNKRERTSVVGIRERDLVQGFRWKSWATRLRQHSSQHVRATNSPFASRFTFSRLSLTTITWAI